MSLNSAGIETPGSSRIAFAHLHFVFACRCSAQQPLSWEDIGEAARKTKDKSGRLLSRGYCQRHTNLLKAIETTKISYLLLGRMANMSINTMAVKGPRGPFKGSCIDAYIGHTAKQQIGYLGGLNSFQQIGVPLAIPPTQQPATFVLCFSRCLANNGCCALHRQANTKRKYANAMRLEPGVSMPAEFNDTQRKALLFMGNHPSYKYT